MLVIETTWYPFESALTDTDAFGSAFSTVSSVVDIITKTILESSTVMASKSTVAMTGLTAWSSRCMTTPRIQIT